VVKAYGNSLSQIKSEVKCFFFIENKLRGKKPQKAQETTNITQTSYHT
jgi:hypothetical protein